MPVSSICKINLQGWNTVLGIFLHTSFYLGTIKSVGVYFTELETSLGTTGTDVGLILGLYSGFKFVPAPLITYLYGHAKFRRGLLVTGAILTSSGLVFGSLVSANGQLALCLSFSGIGGCILSVCYVLSMEETSGQNFQLFYGLGMSGYSMGMVLVPLLADYLMNIYGWRGSMMIIGALAGNIIPLTLLTDVRKRERIEPNAASAETVSLVDDGETTIELVPSDDNDKNTPRQNTTSFKTLFMEFRQRTKDIISQVDPWIYAFVIAGTFGGMVGGGWHAFLIPRVVRSGIPLSKAIYLLYPAAAACFLGRILSGVLHKTICLSTLDLYLLIKLLNTLSLLVDILVPIYALKYVTTFLNAFCIAEGNVLYIFVCKERTSPSFFSVTYTSVLVSLGFGNLTGIYLTGLVADLTGNYNVSFVLLAAFDVVILCLTIPSRYFPSKYKEDNK